MSSVINSDNGVSSGSAGLKSSADSSGVLQLQTNGTAAVTVDTSQNVGIGTGSPSTHLHVYGAGTTSTSYTNGDAAGATLTLQDSAGSSGNGGQILFGASQGFYAGIKGFIENGTGPAGSLLFQTRTTSGNIVERMRIDSSGNVGIGTNSPLERLHVAGGPALVTGTLSALRASSTSVDFSGGAGRIIAIGSDASTVAPLIFGNSTTTTYTERARIDSSGNLLVGRTSAYAAGQGASPTLQVDTNGSGGIVLTNGSNGLLIYRDNVNGITYFFNGSNQASLTAAGAWTNASDAKLKKEITTIKYGLDTVLATQPRSYKRVDVEGDYIGFVAQELKEQVPEVVFGSDTVQYSVDYGSLVAVAFKAIQELKALADTQASTITQLQADVATFKGASA